MSLCARDVNTKAIALIMNVGGRVPPSPRGLGWPLVSRPREWDDALQRAVDQITHAERTTTEHVRLDHRRTDTRVPRQLLHRPNVIAVLEQVSRKRLPEGVDPRVC